MFNLVKSGHTKKKFLKNSKKFAKNLSACLEHGMKAELRPAIAPDERSRTLYIMYGQETNFICQGIYPI